MKCSFSSYLSLSSLGGRGPEICFFQFCIYLLNLNLQNQCRHLWGADSNFGWSFCRVKGDQINSEEQVKGISCRFSIIIILKRRVMLSGRQRSESACDLLCFRDCDNSYQQLITRPQVDTSKPEKLSLKKVLENESNLPEKGYKNTNSQKMLEKKKSETNRSNKSKNEFLLFKKKQQIEGEIAEVDKEMNQLTMRYEAKLKQLKEVKKELEKIKKT